MFDPDVEELATTPLQLLRVIDARLRQSSILDAGTIQTLHELKEDTLLYMDGEMRSS